MGEEREGERKDGRRVGTRWEKDGILAMTNMQCGITQDRYAEGCGFGLVSVAGDQRSQRPSYQNSLNVVNQWIFPIQMGIYSAIATELMDWFHRWSFNFS